MSIPRGHVCPPSDAVHPSDRWESLFVYSFILKFTNLRGKVEGLETCMDFENALLLREPNTIITEILSRFILNLRPQTRNLSTDQISATVASVLGDYFKTSEKTIYWNEDLHRNVDPFQGLEGGFFTASWDFKLKVLRQLVELQLSHNADIKAKIDRAWGVSHNKHKKKDPATTALQPSDPDSQESLQILPIGQDSSRKRYWVADNSPRIYVSTNPWKMASSFKSVASTREEYIHVIDQLKASAPDPKANKRKTKPEQAHAALIEALEARIEAIDAETARIQKARKKIEQRKLLMAQAELRVTRTRRQTKKPDYVYDQAFDEDDGDEYMYEEDQNREEEEFFDDNGLSSRSKNDRHPTVTGQRRSTRTAVLNANGKREAEEDRWASWRGERRSTRLGAPPEMQPDYEPGPKRARTEDSTISTNSTDAGASSSHENSSSGLKIKPTGAAALKPTEIAVENLAGKKRSKFWVYAVEPLPGASSSELSHLPGDTIANDEPSAKGRPPTPPLNGTSANGITPHTPPRNEHHKGMEGSLSPLSPP